MSRSQGKLWVDRAGTVPATSHTDSVGRARCPITGADYIAPSDAARPTLYSEGGGKWSLAFDGVNDLLTCAAAGVPAGLNRYYAVALPGVGGAGTILNVGGSPSAGGLSMGFASLTTLNFSLTGSTTSSPATIASTSAPHTYSGQIATGGAFQFWQDGGGVGSNTYAVSPGGGPIEVGGLASYGNFLNGRLAGLFVCSPPDAPTRAQVETYLSALLA